jgi:hypothetical protein
MAGYLLGLRVRIPPRGKDVCSLVSVVCVVRLRMAYSSFTGILLCDINFKNEAAMARLGCSAKKKKKKCTAPAIINYLLIIE